MNTNIKNRARGFTIIEVMIVLAIAGLILAIVLLAVPALQRSQRNNARSSDSTHISGIVSDFISNHAGQVPTGVSAATPCPANNVCFTGETFSQLKTQTLTTCTAASCTVGTGASAPLTTQANIVTNAKCDPTANTISYQANEFSVVWLAEGTGSNTSQVCIPG